MELIMDFRFRLLEREDFIAFVSGRFYTAMLAPAAATVKRFPGNHAVAKRRRRFANWRQSRQSDFWWFDKERRLGFVGLLA